MMLSPFTPLCFKPHKTDGIGSDYIQTFSTTDRVHIQLLGAPASLPTVGKVYTEPGHKFFFNIQWQDWLLTPKSCLRFTEHSFSPGVYSIEIGGIGTCEPFRVTDDERELENTTLIQYSMKDNRQRTDVMFFIDRMQYFFDFRVPGGFKDCDWSFGVESEQFINPDGDIVQLYGLESTQKRFTLGGNVGVPVWFGEMLNRILVCSHVYFDGVKYSRKESSVPELTVQLDGVNSFVFTQLLQQSVNLDPELEQRNQAILRRIETEEYRLATDTNNRLIY